MDGSGTENDPYIITNVLQLQAMENYLSAYYELGNNIDASATVGWPDGVGFEPVGDHSTPFTGSLDGKGYTIDQLFINRPTTDYVGLFGELNSGASISNVLLTALDITGDDRIGGLVGYIAPNGNCTIEDCSTTGSVSGDDYIGGFVGRVYQANPYEVAITRCYSECTVSGDRYSGGFVGYVYGQDSTIFTDCYSTGTVTGTGLYSGGFAAYLYGTNGADKGCYLSGCYSTSDVTSSGQDRCGGFVGQAYYSVIESCHAEGDISSGDYTGGFIGTSTSTEINQCYSLGNVSGDGYSGGFVAVTGGAYSNCYARGDVTSTGDYVGGFTGSSEDEDNCYSTGAVEGVGDNVGGFNGVESGTTTDCFWDKETSGMETSAGGTGKTTAEMKTKATFTDAGWDFTTVWGIDGVTNNGYPFFAVAVLGYAYFM